MDKYNIGKIMDSIPVSKDKTPEEKLEQIINYLSLCDDDVAIEFIDLSSKTKNNLLQIINPFGKYLESQAKTEKNIERMHSILTELNTLLHKIQFSSNDLYYKAKSLLNRNTIDNNVKLEVANIYQSIAELNKIFDETELNIVLQDFRFGQKQTRFIVVVLVHIVVRTVIIIIIIIVVVVVVVAVVVAHGNGNNARRHCRRRCRRNDKRTG
jgi:hypothetical protein